MTSLALETPKLSNLACMNHSMDKDVLIAIFHALPSCVGETLWGFMTLYSHPGEPFTADELAIATDKNWRVPFYNRQDAAGAGNKGIYIRNNLDTDGCNRTASETLLRYRPQTIYLPDGRT